VPDEYDAFGRKIGEDSMAEVGWGSSTPQTPFERVPQEPFAAPSEPAAAPAPLQPPFAPPPAQPAPAIQVPAMAPPPMQAPMQPIQLSSPMQPVTVTTRRSSGGGIVLLIVLLVVGGIGFGIYKAVSGAKETVDNALRQVTTGIPTIPGTTDSSEAAAPAKPDKPVGPVTGITGQSLAAPANLAPALKKLQNGSYGKLQHFVVRPDRIDASFVTKDGRIRQVQVSPGGVPQVLATTPPGFPTTDTLSIAAIKASAPSKLTKAGAPHVKKKPSDYDYAVYERFGSSLQWIVYYKGGRYVFGDVNGNFQRAYP
jgi:hypothetical protein